MNEFIPITRYTRCKRYSGAIIKCPECHTLERTGHLAWKVKRCPVCEKDINKFEWLIEKGNHSKG